MAQNDIQITTTPPLAGLTLVQGVNGALQSLATDFAGSIDPAAIGGVGPYCTWADTSINWLKRRNAAGTAWVLICPLFEELATKAGSVAAATYAEVAALTSDQGPIIVKDRGGFVWQWVNTAFFTGYRSPLCGKLDFGWTPTPLPWQVEGIGGTLNEDDHGGLIARFRESGLTVALGSWVAGEYKIADMGGGEWKAPDMRNQFLRFTGTDADTANARTIGTPQTNATKAESGSFAVRCDNAGSAIIGSAGGIISFGNATTSSSVALGAGAVIASQVNINIGSSNETRPKNTAFTPVINL